jgi:hypothetical protein
MPNLYPTSSFRIMEPPHEKRTKARHDDVDTSKRGHKSFMRHHAPAPASHPSNHNEDEEPEALQMHAPMESGNWVAIVYSKKTSLRTLTDNREAPVYVGRWMCTNQRFWSFFHTDWYRSVYLPKRKSVVETKWVNWEWMSRRRNKYFNDIKEACDTLELTKMMCFKYDWNKEVICQFYSMLYFDADGQKLIWMTDRKKYEVTTH